MIFGDKSRFAIEFEPLGNRADQFSECHFCYWIDSIEVGNRDFCATICDLVESFRGILSFGPDYADLELFELEPKRAFDCISAGIVENSGRGEGNKWPKFNITYWMDHGYPLDEGRRFEVYLIENELDARILIGDERTQKFLFKKDLKAGEVFKVLLSVWDVISIAD